VGVAAGALTAGVVHLVHSLRGRRADRAAAA
jgi:hypothetical protein